MNTWHARFSGECEKKKMWNNTNEPISGISLCTELWLDQGIVGVRLNAYGLLKHSQEGGEEISAPFEAKDEPIKVDLEVFDAQPMVDSQLDTGGSTTAGSGRGGVSERPDSGLIAAYRGRMIFHWLWYFLARKCSC